MTQITMNSFRDAMHQREEGVKWGGMPLWLAVVASLLIGVVGGAAQPAMVYHFAIRTDGKAGSGTAADPFDGSAYFADQSPPKRNAQGFVSRLDFHLNRLTRRQQSGRSTTYLLAEGTYWTVGDDDNTARKGFFLPPRTTLRGAGIGRTVIKLAGWDPHRGQIHSVVATGDYGYRRTGNWWEARLVHHDHVTVENLTVDCNAVGLGLDPTAKNPDGTWRDSGAALYGVYLSGSHGLIRDVEVRQPFGITDNDFTDENGVGFESFAIGIFANGGRNATNSRIERCMVRDVAGGYVTAITLAGGPGGATNSGVVKDCLVSDGAYAAYSGGNTVATEYSGNAAQGVRFGFRYDTGGLTNVQLVGNRLVTWQGAFVLRSAGGREPVTELTLRENYFSTDGTRHNGERARAVVDLGRSVIGFKAVGNTLLSGDGRPPFFFESGQSFIDLHFDRNVLLP